VPSELPLFQRFPSLRPHLPCLSLGELPTPVHDLPGVPLAWIKRDDLSHPLYGGNKVRKLAFVAAEMQAKRVRRAYTFGATGTNAGVAAAMVCRDLGIALTVLTFDQPDSPTVEKNQALMRTLGAKLVHCGSLLNTALAFYLHPARLRSDSYFLFAGCSNPVGLFGYVNAALELADQIEAGQLPVPQALVVPVGSNGTAAGLAVGLQLAGLPTRLAAVRVAPSHLGPIPTCTTGEVQKMINQTVLFLRKHVPELAGLQVQAPPLDERWYGAGYGVATAQGHAAIQDFAAMGIALEPTYSAKAAAAFLALRAHAEGPLLFWNTYNSRPTQSILGAA
jgi:D-cysteine desulfhydrase